MRRLLPPYTARSQQSCHQPPFRAASGRLDELTAGQLPITVINALASVTSMG